MQYGRYDVQGKALGMPFDLRRPTVAKLKRRLYLPGGPLFPPKVWGWGWTLNFARPATYALLTGIAVAVLAIASVA